MTRLAIIVCTWNRADALAVTLASLAAVRAPPGATIHVPVIDNNSRDDTLARVQALQAGWPLGRRQQLRARSERARSTLLVELKRPGGSLTGQVLRLLSAGVLHPLADLLDSHDLQLLLAHLLASARVLGQLGRIRRHARLCAQPGAHFLNHDVP